MSFDWYRIEFTFLLTSLFDLFGLSQKDLMAKLLSKIGRELGCELGPTCFVVKRAPASDFTHQDYSKIIIT